MMASNRDPRGQRAAEDAAERIAMVEALVEEGRLAEAARAARVNWLTDPRLAPLGRHLVCELQMHVDSAWVALSAGDAGAATQALSRARRLVAG